MAAISLTQPGSVTDYGSPRFVGGRYFITFVIGGDYKLYVLDEPTLTWSFVDTSAVLADTGAYEIFYAGNGWWVVQDADLDWAKSNDLTTWTAIDRPGGVNSQILDLAGNDDGTMWIATGPLSGMAPGTDPGRYWYSTDLDTWTEQEFDLLWFYVRYVAFHDGKWRLSIKTYPDPETNIIVSSTTGLGGVLSWTVEHTETTVPTTYGYYLAKGAPDSDALYFIGSTSDEGSWMRYDMATRAWDTVAASVLVRFASLGPNGAPVIVPAGYTFEPVSVYDPAADTWGDEATGLSGGDAALLYDDAMGASGALLVLFDSPDYLTKLLRFGGAYSAIPRDAVDADELVTFDVSPILIETANPDETLTPTATGGTSIDDETTEADEVLTDEWLLLLHETGTADELMTPSTAAALTLEDDGEATDTPTLYFAATIDDTEPTTSEELEPSYAVWMIEEADADETLTPSTASTATIEDEATADDTAYLVHGQDVDDETIEADETLTPAFAVLLADETITVDEDLIEAGAPSIDTLVESATADDLLTVTVASLAEVIETATATDTLLAKDATAVAWVLNPDTTAAYWYSNFQFTDAVQVGDKLLAVGPDGLCVLTGNTDAGENIDAAIQTGMMDFGSEQKKRVREFRFGLTGGPMTVTVEVQGQDTSYTYAMPAAVTGLPRNARIVPGQGLNSRYWRLTIENENGAHFDNRSTVAEIAVHTRRL